jgi:hypothetical protein
MGGDEKIINIYVRCGRHWWKPKYVGGDAFICELA